MENIEVENEESRTVVRLRTSYWSNKRGGYIQKELAIMRSKCIGYNLIEDEISDTNAQEVLSRIKNIDECEDGIYELNICDETTDWESGYIDEYNYYLRPYIEETLPQPKQKEKKMKFKVTKTTFGELKPGNLFMDQDSFYGEGMGDSNDFNNEFNSDENNAMILKMKCNSEILGDDKDDIVYLIEGA